MNEQPSGEAEVVTVKGEVTSLNVCLGNVEIRPVTPPGGKTTTGYRVFVDGKPVPCTGIKIVGRMQSIWEVELKLLSGTVGEDGKRFCTMRSGHNLEEPRAMGEQ